MVQQVIERARLGVLTKIGQGGQGVVYSAPNVTTKFAASMVYKEYKAATLAAIDFTALAAMPALVEESLSYTDGERLVSIAAWPCAIVADDSGSTGFVMPAIPQEFFISLTTVKGESTSTAEFQHLLNHSSVLAARGITLNDVQRYSLLREVASGLAFLHKHGVCVGDISPKNLLFSLTPHEAVYFIDCDAMRINGVSALTQVETPGWAVPAGEDLATIYSDTYKLGLLGLRLLAGDHDTTNPAHLPSTTPGLLRQIITETLTRQPQSRPLPEAWSYVLGQAIEEAQYRTKTAAPASAPLAAPEIPIVHSRPSGASAPSVRPSAPPPSPSAPRLSAPPATAPASSKAAIWGAVAAVAVVIAVAAVVIAVVLGHRSTGTTSSTPNSYTTPPSSYAADSPAAQAPPTPTRPTFVPPPSALQGPDHEGNAQCEGGFALPRGYRVSPTAPTSYASFTSCAFAIVVGQSFLATNPDLTSPRNPISVVAQSPRANCLDVQANNPNVQCSGNAFLMQCQEEGGDQWITCRGGNNAIVYIY
jgi:serine/threonine protein kinase